MQPGRRSRPGTCGGYSRSRVVAGEWFHRSSKGIRMESSGSASPRAGWRKRPSAAPRLELDPAPLEAARAILTRTKVGIFIVAFQAERFIESVLDRIPEAIR